MTWNALNRHTPTPRPSRTKRKKTMQTLHELMTAEANKPFTTIRKSSPMIDSAVLDEVVERRERAVLAALRGQSHADVAAKHSASGTSTSAGDVERWVHEYCEAGREALARMVPGWNPRDVAPDDDGNNMLDSVLHG